MTDHGVGTVRSTAGDELEGVCLDWAPGCSSAEAQVLDQELGEGERDGEGEDGTCRVFMGA